MLDPLYKDHNSRFGKIKIQRCSPAALVDQPFSGNKRKIVYRQHAYVLNSTRYIWWLTGV